MLVPWLFSHYGETQPGLSAACLVFCVKLLCLLERKLLLLVCFFLLVVVVVVVVVAGFECTRGFVS